MFAFIPCRAFVAFFDTLDSVRLVAPEPDERDVLHPPFAEPCLVAERLALQSRILEWSPFREEMGVALLGPEVRPAPDVRAFSQEYAFRHPALVLLPMPAEGRLGVEPRRVAIVSETRDRRFGRQPVLQEVAGDVELEMPGADSIELVRDITGPREEFFVHLALPMESLVVGGRLWLIVDKTVARQPGPLALTSVLVSLEFDLEERNAVAASRPHAVVHEAIGVRVFR